MGKRYDGRWVVRRVSLTINRGDRLVVTGPNGAGKSTLLRMLAGLITPSEGKVTPPPGDPRQAMALSAIEQALYPTLTVAEHLELSGNLRACDPRTDELVARVGLARAADVTAGHLSTGMKARLKLALAIQARPAVLLLDEPGAGLDEAGRALVESVVAEQTERGGLILATNDPAERRFANAAIDLAH